MEIIETETKNYNLKESLNTFFGFDSFKLNQELIIDNILQGKDTFVLMPTGGGKSLCYQLPALMVNGLTLVISPLIALMKNQVDSIRSYGEVDSVAHFLNSSLTKTQMDLVKNDVITGKTKLLFIAPETLTKEENLIFLRNSNVSFVAIDEAHCISEWGHDFRPEYRKIRAMIEAIGDDIPLMALTATATPKVRLDIVKNLHLKEETTFVSSFNRDNLYYEIRPKVTKDQAVKEIVQLIKGGNGASGIVYVQSRKSTEEIAKILQVNGVRAAAYHAGLDTKTRNTVQDNFLMERTDVVVATIAFGMGIDKPDVRFVIHYDIPKSIENYYQETGRAGRDGIKAKCVAFYSYKDILRLEKFHKDKTFAEREMSSQLLEEIIAYSETSACRRKFLLHYFGEQFNDDSCNKMCDNCKHPKEKQKVNEEMSLALKAVKELNQNYKINTLVDFVKGVASREIKDFKFDTKELFGNGKDKEVLFWHTMFRQAILNNLLYKEIEQYGILKLTQEGLDFIKKPYDLHIPINRDLSSNNSVDIITNNGKAGAVLDSVLLDALKDLRRREAQQKKMQPWIMFMDPPLHDMASYYPITMEELLQIPGVTKGKATKFGQPFIDLIKNYVEENNIERPQDIVVKQLANKSKSKVAIIQGVDRKLSLEDIADNSKISIEELLEEMNHIVNSGTKLDINYYIDENIDDEVVDEIFDYLSESKTGSVDEAFAELKEDDINREEIQMVRIKFMSTVAN